MLKNRFVLDKFLFFLVNLIIIFSGKNLVQNIAISIWILLLFLIQKTDFRKKISFVAPGMFFLIPSVIISGLKIDGHKFVIEIPWELFFKSSSGILAMGIFIGDTEFSELCIMLKKLKIPDFLIEIIIYMHKMIILMLDEVKRISIAMKNRGGFKPGKKIYRDVALLWKNLLQKMYSDMGNYNKALYSRGYRGSFPINENIQVFSKRNLILLMGYLICALTLIKIF